MGPADDDALLAATARGDARAFEILANRYGERVLAFALAVLGNRAEAEDVAQEVFVKLWQHAAAWQPGRARLSTWLYRVTRNAALNHRDRRRGRELPWDATLAATEPATPGPDAVVEAEADRAQTQATLRAELAALPEAQRSAVALVYGEGLRQREAAAAMGLSLKAFEALLVRARRRLRAALAGQEATPWAPPASQECKS